ncbi:iron ABC transporter permease (plasmid) [Neorhizobium sp. SOG26]|uniref:lipocalin-like domain-containing protein n=1 Tax=Neorhizobium sp. SOG26 TaxID=2060726 RepID=UPI000E5988F8|nr:lipocalin-like domain-containing protein [Neorhizobium sp. SOG26]AXV18324.1 iron ABC transporter permease [Neorhizobium sp. SOG26]
MNDSWSKRALALLLLIAALPVVVLAQGFAGLGSDAEGFSVPRRGTLMAFPADHGPHPDFRIEWWYVTANLEAEDGRVFGVQWTLFRSALAPGNAEGWRDPQIWIGHAALTTPDHHYVAERLGRGGIGQAGVETTPFRAWIDHWEMKSNSLPDEDELARLDLFAAGDAFSYQLTLETSTPPVPQGDRGYSVKSEAGQASHYYSQPFYQIKGALVVGGKPVAITGKGWLDREWSSQPLAADQEGWDWFSLHLDSGDKLMAFRLRDAAGGFISANWIKADGETEMIDTESVSLEPLRTAKVNGRPVPVEWRIQVPAKRVDITTHALNDQSWMGTSTPYWEGPIRFGGSHSGVGYLEMTGY